MNEPIKRAYDTAGESLNRTIAYCMLYGEVQANSRYFVAGWFCREGAMQYPVSESEADCFWVQMLAGDFRDCIRSNAGRVPCFAWDRRFKGKGKINIYRY